MVVFMVRRRMQDADLCSLHCLGVRWKTTGYSSGTGTGTLLYLVGQRGRKYFFLPLKFEFLPVSGKESAVLVLYRYSMDYGQKILLGAVHFCTWPT